MAIITLTTDFGIVDEYAGLMKAAILAVDAAATIVDITHGIDAQDIRQAAYSIESTYRYFPDGTVHVVVVDPEVGTERAIIAAAASGQYFIAPDNGVLSLVLTSDSPRAIVRVENQTYFKDAVSHTFHGRDIMAPVAGHIGFGVPLDQMGPEIVLSDLVLDHSFRSSSLPEGQISGTIVAIDRFGNLITNISETQLQDAVNMEKHKAGVRVLVGEHGIGLTQRYADVPLGSPLALIGSRGYLEIAVNGGSARSKLNIEKGTPVRVCCLNNE